MAVGPLSPTSGWTPAFASGDKPGDLSLYSTEFGLFYAISPAYQRNGYAAEAAQALVDYAFQHLRLKRIVATTEYDNTASMGIMRKLGMRVEKNPRPEPPWLQAVGVLENRRNLGGAVRMMSGHQHARAADAQVV